MRHWTCTIIQKEGKYSAILLIENVEVEGLPSEVDYRTLREAIRAKTGIHILKRKDMIFEKLSDFEKIATIDATQRRWGGKDCRVRLAERKAGWKPKWEFD